MTTLMKKAKITFGVICVLLVAVAQCHAEDTPKSSPVPERICDKVQALFQIYYPKAQFTNLQVNGIHFEYNVATFDFPYAGRPHAKHESTTQRGPKQGGILCSIYMEHGEYRGQLALTSHGNGQFGPNIIDRTVYKQLLMATYSPKRHAHLSVSLSYPPDASEEFLRQFRELIADFESDMDGTAQPNGAANGASPR
jgi:hypothetical protein